LCGEGRGEKGSGAMRGARRDRARKRGLNVVGVGGDERARERNAKEEEKMVQKEKKEGKDRILINKNVVSLLVLCFFLIRRQVWI
jgi:hypothetical protein